LYGHTYRERERERERERRVPREREGKRVIDSHRESDHMEHVSVVVLKDVVEEYMSTRSLTYLLISYGISLTKKK
jgi:hypothetical protein